MKVVHLSTDDTRSGAGRAAYRLHHGLRGIGVDSWMLVDRKESQESRVAGPGSTWAKAVDSVWTHFLVDRLKPYIAAGTHKAKPDDKKP